MESINDLFTGANEYVVGALAVIAAILAWVTARLEWWRGQNKFIKATVAVGTFLAFVMVLSIITAPFT